MAPNVLVAVAGRSVETPEKEFLSGDALLSEEALLVLSGEALLPRDVLLAMLVPLTAVAVGVAAVFPVGATVKVPPVADRLALSGEALRSGELLLSGEELLVPTVAVAVGRAVGVPILLTVVERPR